jgi:hypothetical protein
MYDLFNIALHKTDFHFTETADGREHGYIRWGIIEGSDGQGKVVAFYVPALEAQYAHADGKDLLAESDAVVERPEAQSGPPFQAYEWAGQEFASVEADQQSWFKFK